MNRRMPFILVAAAGAMSTLSACTCNGCVEDDTAERTRDTSEQPAVADAAPAPSADAPVEAAIS